MKRIISFCLVFFFFFSCAFGFDGQLPKEETVKCKGLSEQQIFDYLKMISVDTLGAEIASRDSTLLLAYIEKRPQNCVAVIYTIKFLIEPEKFSYAIYYGITAKDNTEECLCDVFFEMKELEKILRRLFKA